MYSTLIDNEWIEGEGYELVSSTPDESQVLWQKTTSSTQQVIKAVASAKAAQYKWANTPLPERIKIIEKFAEILNAEKNEIAQVISQENGKPMWEALTEVGAMANKVAISIKAQDERAGSRTHNNFSLAHHAHGVMAVFGPFNFPGHLPNGHIVPALLAGNSIVFKPSELTPLTAEVTVKAWIKAGLPAGVINLIQGAREVGEALVKSDIDGVLFTGSYNTGKIIHQQLAGKPEIMLALEMGGNNAFIASQVEDIELAANTLLHSAFLSAGQRCTCTRRLILVESENSDVLIEKLIAACNRIIIGNNNQQDPFMGPVINRSAAEKLLQVQEELLSSGAQALKKMEAVDETLVYLSPGILDVSNVENIPDDEYFGPLLQVYRVKDIDEAIKLANATRFGLAAGIISDNPAEQEKFRQHIKAGVVSVNLPTAGASSELPFGGVGASGNHRPSAYYAADYCAWPQAISQGDSTKNQAQNIDLENVRGLR
ncbi:succinylglutamate-semialdehyde dehydrogenase [Agarilytica rhodophyticola]|uniref:succinylglutamate-semialdehyde dehydrogenase n=1 Tax=Agarilytica rhodophyticola TaxID=1737490 RepID=UPI000B3466A8|nr:succinylglutamate-semialdehyde dehydrogenase [Agarilytica rhodophyticola]